MPPRMQPLLRIPRGESRYLTLYGRLPSGDRAVGFAEIPADAWRKPGPIATGADYPWKPFAPDIIEGLGQDRSRRETQAPQNP